MKAKNESVPHAHSCKPERQLALTCKASEVHPRATVRPGAGHATERDLFRGKARKARSPRQGDLVKDKDMTMVRTEARDGSDGGTVNDRERAAVQGG